MSFKQYGGRQYRPSNNIVLSQHGIFYNHLIPTKIGDNNITTKVYTDLKVERNLTVGGTFYMQTFLTDDLHVTGYATIDNDLTLGTILKFEEGSTISSYQTIGENDLVTPTTVLAGNIDTNYISLFKNDSNGLAGNIAFSEDAGGIIFRDGS